MWGKVPVKIEDFLILSSLQLLLLLTRGCPVLPSPSHIPFQCGFAGSLNWNLAIGLLLTNEASAKVVQETLEKYLLTKLGPLFLLLKSLWTLPCDYMEAHLLDNKQLWPVASTDTAHSQPTTSCVGCHWQPSGHTQKWAQLTLWLATDGTSPIYQHIIY